ncbi:MAG: amidohydrolase family protein [Sphingomonadaceae bacterium]|nr:amidohydrolase family protein [Sphingomonadaceae bacterium]
MSNFDTVIRGATIVDGLMTPSYISDIGIRDGQIAHIGAISEKGREEIDAKGLHVTPGFIDMHMHMDGQLFWDGMATPACFSGVTSIAIGNCGFALTPAHEGDREWVSKMLSRVEGIPQETLAAAIPFNWETFGEYLSALEELDLGVNVGAMVPHSTIRYYVMGEDARKREATPEELEAITSEVRAALDAGGLGFSSSWNNGHADADGIPVPSRFASRDELIAICAVLADYPGTSIEFTPKGLLSGVKKEDFELMGQLSRAAGGCPINWNALIDIYSHPGYWKNELEMMAEENLDGARIFAINSVFPIDADFCFATAGNLFDDYPHWSKALASPLPERKAMLADPEYRAKMKKDMVDLQGLFSPKWDDVEIKAVHLPENKGLEGKRLTEVAGNNDPIDTMLDLAVSEDLKTGFFRYAVQNADEAAIAEIIRHPLSIPGVSDGGAHLEYLCQYGWPIKLLSDWVRERNVISLEDAVRRCSFVPAQLLGFKDRGCIQVGKAADLVLIDYENLSLGKVTWADDLPGGHSRQVHFPTGIARVIVNGQTTVIEGEVTDKRPGELLRRTRYQNGSESEMLAAAE